MTLRETIRVAQINTMKLRDTEVLGTLRMLWSAIKNTEIDVHHELADTDIEQIVSKQIKQLQDVLQDFKIGKRQDLIEKTKKELAVLEQYAPTQLSDAAVIKMVSASIKETGAQDKSDIGKVMSLVMKQVNGGAGGKRVQAIVFRLLQ